MLKIASVVTGLSIGLGLLGSLAGCNLVIDLRDVPSLDDASVTAETSVPKDGSSEGEGGADVRATDARSEGSTACGGGGACTPEECKVGEYRCVDGGDPVCVGSGSADDGTPCGVGMTSVCSKGTCSACTGGADCSDPNDPCVKKAIDCSSGKSVCSVAVALPDGTSCGNALFCFGGACTACKVGDSCSPGGNPCDKGTVTECAAGFVTCADQGSFASAGTSCTTSAVPTGVCDGKGTCAACAAFSACTPTGQTCQQGTTSCSAGVSCGSPHNIDEGQPCGTGTICAGGECVACNAQSCPNGCCDATGCVTGAQKTSECGKGGAACAACAVNQSCILGGGGCACPAATSAYCGGACTSLQTDAKNCGACGNDCTALPHVNGPATCVAGACVVPTTSCVPGWTHCPANAGAICETDISKPATCGSCTNSCATGAPQCAGSGNTYSCTTLCSPPTPTLCKGSCVDTTSNGSYCGDCNTTCQNGTTCSNGKCVCPAGTVDCNGACQTPGPSNGCGAGGLCAAPCPNPTAGSGAAICSGTSCAIACTAGMLCGTACVDTSSNSSYCGSCTSACPSAETCISSSCKCSSASQTYCPNSNTCVTTSSDSNNCGICGNICPSGTECVGGGCVCDINSCRSGCCSGQSCVPTGATQSNTNCGTLGNTCMSCPNSSETCASGVCGCPSGQLGDSNNCGTCGHACGAGLACNAGQCACTTASCSPGCCTGSATCTTLSPTACGPTCVNCSGTQSSNVAASTCSGGGQCQISQCAVYENAVTTGGVEERHPTSYYMDCDGVWSDGCETEPDTTSNCGQCSFVCASGVGCGQGGNWISATNGISSCTTNGTAPPPVSCGNAFYCGHAGSG